MIGEVLGNVAGVLAIIVGFLVFGSVEVQRLPWNWFRKR